MKWLYKKSEYPDYFEWHKKFAWSPIIIGDYKHWLCFVWRRAVLPEGYPESYKADYSRWIHQGFECSHWEFKEIYYV